MTVSGFRQFIQPLIRTQKVSEIPHNRHKLRIGIDATQYIYKAIYVWNGHSINELLKLACSFCKSSIPAGTSATLVFDGQRVVLKDRSKSSLLSKVEKYNRDKHYGTLTNFTMPPRITHSVARQLENHGVECIVAPFEADAQLAYLSQTKRIDAVLSLDVDSIIFGCDVLLQNFQKSDQSVQVVPRKKILSSMDLSTDFLLQASSVLSGTDYATSLYGMSFQRAHEWIQLYGSLEEVILRIYDAYLSMGKTEQFKHFPTGMQRLVRHYHRKLPPKKSSFLNFLAEYVLKLEKALYCLHHHIVYDDDRKAFTQLNIASKKASPPPLSLLSFSPNAEHLNTEDINSLILRLRKDNQRELCPIKSVSGNVFPESKASPFCKTFSLTLP